MSSAQLGILGNFWPKKPNFSQRGSQTRKMVAKVTIEYHLLQRLELSCLIIQL